MNEGVLIHNVDVRGKEILEWNMYLLFGKIQKECSLDIVLGLGAKILDYSLKVSDFELQSCIHFGNETCICCWEDSKRNDVAYYRTLCFIIKTRDLIYS